MFYSPFVLSNLFSVTGNGSETQRILKDLCPEKITGRPTTYEHIIHKLSHRETAIPALPLEFPPLLTREPPRRIPKLVESGLAKLSHGNKQL